MRTNERAPGARWRRVLTVGAALLAGCGVGPLESPVTKTDGQIYLPLTAPRTQVDVLFLVDNSNSMEPMAKGLRDRFGDFLRVFQDLAGSGIEPDLHLGVVTSDYGAGATGAGTSCDPSPGGQRGRLQALGAAADASCRPPVGANFVHYDFAHPDAANLPTGQSLETTFACMASVGASGCGFEHQLESVYAALHNNLPENAGFLRPDALLAVVFVTNEDDSSAPPDTDVFSPSRSAAYGYFDTYRQTRWGVECDDSPDPMHLAPYGDSHGPLTACHAATNPPGHEYELSRYIDFFTRPASQGGVKQHPEDVLLFAIDAPESPFVVSLAHPPAGAGAPFVACSPLDESAAIPCVPYLMHSCQNPSHPELFGDPPVRLNTVVRAARHSQVSSICDADYSQALSSLAQAIGSEIGPRCVQGKLGDPADPDCVVEDVTTLDDGSSATAEIPRCDRVNDVKPCWRLTPNPVCQGVSPDGVALGIDRDSSVPTNVDTHAYCATVASATDGSTG